MINDPRRLRSGYYNLGSIQIPPKPQAIVLTDRADGSKWLVSFNTSAPERLSIVSDYVTISQTEELRRYEADDGPVMDADGEYRLMVRGGRLGFDYTPFPVAVRARDDSPLYARQTNDKRLLIMDAALIHIGTRS